MEIICNNGNYLFVSLAVKYGIKPEDILLVHDELDKPLGKMAIKHGGSARWVSHSFFLHLDICYPDHEKCIANACIFIQVKNVEDL